MPPSWCRFVSRQWLVVTVMMGKDGTRKIIKEASIATLDTTGQLRFLSLELSQVHPTWQNHRLLIPSFHFLSPRLQITRRSLGRFGFGFHHLSSQATTRRARLHGPIEDKKRSTRNALSQLLRWETKHVQLQYG